MTELFFNAWPLLVKGTWMTLQVLAISAFLSFSLGFIWGICSANRLRIPILSETIDVMTFIFRAVPFYVQLLVVYFVLPDLLGCNLEPFPASVLALGMCSSGYVAQIVRAGINSIAIEQWEVAFALGYNRWQTLRFVILPQMIRNVLPAFNNELDSLLKSTSIVSSIGLLELTRMGMNLVSKEMEPIPIYSMLALFYVILSAIFNLISRSIERKFCYVRN